MKKGISIKQQVKQIYANGLNDNQLMSLIQVCESTNRFNDS